MECSISIESSWREEHEYDDKNVVKWYVYKSVKKELKRSLLSMQFFGPPNLISQLILTKSGTKIALGKKLVQ